MVIVTIEIGHQANFLKEPSIEGFTHDWTVFVGGYEGSKIEHFVEKVIFNLHKTFKRPTRVISEPPYRVSECGYAGFTLPIDIYFKTQQKPRKITFMYDLFLNAQDSPPINNVRYEKLKFQNPTPDFKAKLIKAGGSEQGLGSVQPAVSDRFYSPENKISSKAPEKKHKEKKLKKSKKIRPPSAPSSPHPSLSSLSSMSSSDEELEKPIPSKKEKEPPLLKKEPSFSSSLKKESSSSSSKDKSSKHKSSGSSGKEKHSSDKNKDGKPHKVKEKERSSSEHHKEGKSKEKESSSHKSADSHGKHKDKDREGSHSSNKSSSSSFGEKKSSSSSHKEKSSSKEKDSGSKEKHKSSHKSRESEEKTSIKEREKEKHSHKDASSSSFAESSKKSQESSKAKSSHEKDKHSKNVHKRPLSPGEAFESEKKKIKRSNSSAESDMKIPKVSSVEKERSIPSVIKESKDSKPKDSHKMLSSSSSSLKSKEHKKKSSEKSKHSSHTSEGKSKPGRDITSAEKKQITSEKQPDGLQRAGKIEKPDPFTKSEKVALSADFQPQLLLSPLRCKSEDENGRTPGVDSNTEESSLKKAKSNSRSSLSSLSSDHESSKSDIERENHNEKTNQIISGLTDSDSDSDGPPVPKSLQKEVKPTNFGKDSVSVKPKKSNLGNTTEKVRKTQMDNGNMKGSSSPVDKRNGGHDLKERIKRKSEEREKNKTVDSNTVFSSPRNVTEEDPSKNGLNVLAPNGIPIGELISINEKIEKAQQDSNKDLINSIIDIIADTDDFDIDDSAVFFDICSLDKSCVLQIQSILRD